VIEAVDSRRNIRWIIIGGVTCLFISIFLPTLFRHEGNESPKVSPSPVANDSPDNQEAARVTQNLAVPSNESALKKDLPSEPPAPAQFLPPPDERALDVHRKMAAGLNAKLREATKGLYAGAFRQLQLPVDLQEKVIDILTQQEKHLAQEAFEAAQSGGVPALPAPDVVRAQQAQQDQQLRSVLGDAGFAEFSQYRATIPDRSMIDAMNQQGANLSESQSQQLLQVLTEERQQIIGQSPIMRNLNSMPPDQAMAVIGQQQALLQQAVGNRVQSILTPEQATLLQGVFSQFSMSPKAR
jgi:hypothetical protein